MTQKSKPTKTVQETASGTSDIASGTVAFEPCPKSHALCEGACKLKKGHKGKHECKECGLYFG